MKAWTESRAKDRKPRRAIAIDEYTTSRTNNQEKKIRRKEKKRKGEKGKDGEEESDC